MADTILKDKKAVGVIICRMQVPFLTASHASLIKTVISRHDRIIIFLGHTNKNIDGKNPYPFEFRKQMLMRKFEDEFAILPHAVTIVPFPDQDDNSLWVKTLDLFIGSFLNYDEAAHLYGGRDSFIPFYKKESGKYETTEFAPTDYDSGTELRMLEAIEQPKYSIEAAKAILWTLRQVQK